MPSLFPDEPVEPFVAYAQVAPEQGIDNQQGGLTYGIPTRLSDIQVGQRVVVPLGRGNKKVTGYVLELMQEQQLPSQLEKSRIKSIIERDANSVSLTPELMQLARWLADYYVCPLGMVLVTMLPAAVKRGTGQFDQRVVRLNREADFSDEALKDLKLSKLQKRVLELLREHDEQSPDDPWLEKKQLALDAGAKTATPVQLLISKDLLIESFERIVRANQKDPLLSMADTEPERKPTLTEEQTQACDAIDMAMTKGFAPILLQGVTGSGKTEVYLRAIDKMLQRDPQAGAIVLVPEISLTPQTVGRFVRRFGSEHVAVLHSALTDAQRHQQWRRIRDNQANIVVGARSAIFAPLARPGLLIVDEEHDGSYKQDQLPRYHARDVAIKRAQIANIPVVLGSATPSLESYYNAVGHKQYQHLKLTRRVTGYQLPRVDLVSIMEEQRKRTGVHLITQPLETAMRQTFADRKQAMLLLNRRGYANYIACPDKTCGWMKVCDYCDAMMVYHKDQKLPKGGVVRCHHCQAEQMLPERCPECDKHVSVFGLGTQRVEEEIMRKFPDIRMLRMDSDSMRTGRDYFTGLEAFRRGEIDLLVGTQMIAKGLDFPNVRLVGVIAADTSLHIPDFRASERTFQLIAQVAGRAGRGDEPGQVMVQSFDPNSTPVQLASRHAYDEFARQELAVRERTAYPPVGRMVRIVVRDRDDLKCHDHVQQLAEHLREMIDQKGLQVRMMGPAPCAISRIAEYYRQQMILLAGPPQPAVTLQNLLAAMRSRFQVKSDIHTAIDVDPIDLL